MIKKKVWILGGVVISVAIVVGGYSWWHYYRPYDITVGWNNVKTGADALRYERSLAGAWMKDTVGFDTPEETFDAFRKALKAGDYELASQYFVPEKQEEMLKKFKNTNGYAAVLVGDLYLPNEKTSLSKDKVRLNARDEINNYRFGYDLVYNSYNNIWKMLEL